MDRKAEEIITRKPFKANLFQMADSIIYDLDKTRINHNF